MRKIIFIFLIIAIISSNCSKGYLSDLQNNPNSPTSAAATPQLVLPSTLTSIISILNGTGTNSSYEPEGVWLGYWMYAPGYSFNSTVENYLLTSTSPQLWDPYYSVLSNLNTIAQTTSSNATLSNYYAISQILEALCFKNLVDLYNDVPYSQALKGAGNFNPGYDKGSAIYDSLVAKLDQAITTIQSNLNSTTVTVPTNDDILFKGNMTNWLLFANTIKLRMLVQQSAVAAKQSYLQSEASKTAAVGFLTQDALVNPGYSGAQPSPLYGAFGLSPSGAINSGFTYISANQTAVNFYKQTKDQRLGYFYAPNNVYPTNATYNNITTPINFNDYAGNYIGNQVSISGGGSGIGSGVIQGPTQSGVMMLASESYFLQSEATVYGWLTGGNATAQTLYQDGITASYEYLNVGGSTSSADAFATAYYGQNINFVAFPVAAPTDSLIHTIITQKWAALNSISNVEAYNDWRRTYNPAMNSGYPIVPVSLSTSNVAPHMPFRYFYPTEESTSNGTAYLAEGGDKIDVFNNKIFWMP